MLPAFSPHATTCRFQGIACHLLFLHIPHQSQHSCMGRRSRSDTHTVHLLLTGRIASGAEEPAVQLAMHVHVP